MTLESCATDCAGYTYFGTEYGRECRLVLSSFPLSDAYILQVTVEIVSLLALLLLLQVIVLLPVPEMLQRSAALGIVSQSTRKGLDREPRLGVAVTEEPRHPLNRLALDLKKLAYLPAGCILDVFSESSPRSIT